MFFDILTYTTQPPHIRLPKKKEKAKRRSNSEFLKLEGQSNKLTRRSVLVQHEEKPAGLNIVVVFRCILLRPYKYAVQLEYVKTGLFFYFL